MNTNIRFIPLDSQLFAPLFSKDKSELEKIGAYMFYADECPCYPCRVSLKDAEIGEQVLALTYEHHSAQSPYRSSGPIFVRADAKTANLSVNEVPTMLNHRVLSIRGYNSRGLMIAADTSPGTEIVDIVNQQFADTNVDYIHIHNAGPGCFNCSVKRA